MAIKKDGTRLHYKSCVDCGKPFYTAAKYTKLNLCSECANNQNQGKPIRGRPSMAIPEVDIFELKKELKK